MSGIRLPEIHGANKGLDPHAQPGKQKSFPIQTVNKGMPTHPIPKPRIGQGRARLRRKVKAPLPIASPHLLPVQPITEHDLRMAMPLPEPTNQSQNHVQSQIWPRQSSQHHLIDPAQIPQQIGPKIQHRPTPSYPDPYTRPPPKPLDISEPLNSQKDLLGNDSDRKIEIEENFPFQEGIISEIYERPDNSYVQEPQELTDLIDTTKLIQKYLPKQMDIDKILDIIKRKVLKGTHLPLTIKEIQVGYLTSPYFKDLYLFLSQNKLPSKRSAIKKVETLAESFVLLDSLIFKLVTNIAMQRIKAVEAADTNSMLCTCKTQWYIMGMLIIITLGMLYLVTNKIRKTSFCKGRLFSNNTKILLFLSNAHSYVPIKLHRVAGSIHLFRIKGRLKPENVKLKKNWIWDVLEIDWSDVSITLNDNEIHLPRSVIIPFRERYRARKLFRKHPLLFYILLKQGKTWFSLVPEPINPSATINNN